MDETTDLEELRRRFNLLMQDAIHRCITEIKYRPSYVIAYMADHDGVDTARWLVNLEGEVSSGFTRLWEEGRLELSAEALVLLPEFSPLFSVEDRRKAYDSLQQYRYRFPPGITRP